jgi:hypothetical protein
MPVGNLHQPWVVNPANCRRASECSRNFPQFSAIGTALVLILAPARERKADRQKGRLQMSAQSHFTRTLVAFAAALLVSSVAVGAAVGPAQVASTASVSARA